MIIKIYAAGKTEDGSGEKSGRGADSRSAYFDWIYFLEGLGKVKL